MTLGLNSCEFSYFERYAPTVSPLTDGGADLADDEFGTLLPDGTGRHMVSIDQFTQG